MSNILTPPSTTLPSSILPYGSQELVVGNWLTQWQTYLLNLLNANNRLAGGTGFDNDNLANDSTTSRNLNLNIQDFVGVGFLNHNGIPNTQPPFSAPRTFIDAMPVINDYANARTEFEGFFNYYTDNASETTTIILSLQRADNTGFTTNLITIPVTPTSTGIGQLLGHRRADNASFQSAGNLPFKFVDKGTKLANQVYYYRLQYKLNNNTQNSYAYFDQSTCNVKNY
jgi:hypothetical protein